jgi:hypothetical protein
MSASPQGYSLVIHSQNHSHVPTTAVETSTVHMDRLYKKLQWRLMPLFCICIILNYLDRTSLAFASIQMTQQLQFSPEVLGLGGGLFFISYCLMQVGEASIALSLHMCCMCAGCHKVNHKHVHGSQRALAR